MANSWQERRWGDLATLEYGKSLRGYENSAGPYPVYGTNGLIGSHSEALCNHPGVVIGRKGAYRGVHYAQNPFYVIDTAFYLEPKVDLDLKWAYYTLLTQDINGMDSGSAIPSTSRADFYALPITVPPLPEQHAIARILGALDDKIELNRRMNETLEAMARAIFKSWFIDFDPVRRNIARRAGQNQPSPQPSPKGRGSFRGGYDFTGLLETARELRSKQTSAEAFLWELLRDRRFLGMKFRRQHQIGDYVADFYCHPHRLVVELDGPVHDEEKNVKKDAKRDAYLCSLGFTVLRFPNEQLMEEPESVLRTIARTANPLPLGDGWGEGGVAAPGPLPLGEGAGEGSVGERDRLFPDSFQDSPLGKIPKGWRVKGLDEIAHFLNGLALQKFPHDGGDSLPVIKIAQLRAGNTKGADRAASTLPPEYIVEDGDALFSWSGSLEVVAWCGGRGALNQHLFKVTSQEYPKWFYYHWIREHLADFQSIAAGKATTMGHIQRHHLSDAKVVAPNPSLLSAVDHVIGPLFQAVIANKLQSRTLAAIRDALLPKLISGEIRVKDAERFAAEAS